MTDQTLAKLAEQEPAIAGLFATGTPRTPAEVNAAYDQAPCPNCDDGCTASRFCDGCDETLCDGCWTCHNRDDEPCHCIVACPNL